VKRHGAWGKEHGACFSAAKILRKRKKRLKRLKMLKGLKG